MIQASTSEKKTQVSSSSSKSASKAGGAWAPHPPPHKSVTAPVLGSQDHHENDDDNNNGVHGKALHPLAAYDDNPTPSCEAYPPAASFDAMRLHDSLLHGIFASGFEEPSPIQARAVPPCLAGRDVIVQAQSGQGKTATYAIATLQQIEPSLHACQALVLAPVRELAHQVRDVFASLAQFMPAIHCAVFTGGTPVHDDIHTLQQHQHQHQNQHQNQHQQRRTSQPHIVVATPGRLLDLIRRRALDVSRTRILVLDEADEMLQLGFTDQIFDIYTSLSAPTLQSIVVSATMPPEALDMTARFMADPVRILVSESELALKGIRQYYIMLDDAKWKLDCLLDIYQLMPITQSIIFVNTRATVDWLASRMQQLDFAVACIHADLPASERRAVMDRFRTCAARVLIATDLAGRGLDVQQVSLVVNFELPPVRDEAYVHRIGRCGRWARKGVAINLVGPRDVRRMEQLQRRYRYTVDEMPADVAAIVAGAAP